MDVMDPVLQIQWHFGVDPDPDPSIFIIALQGDNKNQI